MLWGPLSRFGLAVALACAAADQALKLWLIFVFDLRVGKRVEFPPYFDLVLVWNEGISYGLFPQRGPFGQWALLALMLIAVMLLWIWLARASSRLIALSVGLIIGGAIGNGIDRLHWPGVMDFLLLYLTLGGIRYEWFAFNLADAVIVAGVAGLLCETLFAHDSAAKAP